MISQLNAAGRIMTEPRYITNVDGTTTIHYRGADFRYTQEFMQDYECQWGAFPLAILTGSIDHLIGIGQSTPFRMRMKISKHEDGVSIRFETAKDDLSEPCG